MKQFFIVILCLAQAYSLLASHEAGPALNSMNAEEVVSNISPLGEISKTDDQFSCPAFQDDTISRFARFDHHDEIYGYYFVKLSELKSPFERCVFYNTSVEAGIYMENKGEFHNDSALFYTKTGDKKVALQKLTDLYLNAQKKSLQLSDVAKAEIVAQSPFFKEKNSKTLFPNHGPSQPIDSVVLCTSAFIACSDNIYSYPASYNDVEYNILAPPSTGDPPYPDYGCLGSQPCPSWYYMQVSQAGPITILIEQTSPSLDVDFICWGPFTSLTDGCAVGLTDANIIDCSFSAAAVETCFIPEAELGRFYILLITNYAGLSGDAGTITFQQTGGTGITDCNIVINCSILAMTATPSSCDPDNNTFSVSGNIEFSNPPLTGFLTVTDNTAVPPVTHDFLPPFINPYAYTLDGIPCDGLNHTLIATFSDNPTCTMTQTDAYTSPGASCPVAILSGGGFICAGGTNNVIITFSGVPPPYDFTYDIEGIEITITGWTGSTYLIPEFFEGTYTMISVSNINCASGTASGTATVTIIPIPGPPSSAAPTFYNCGPGTVSLLVVDDAGISTRWYDAPTGGTLLFTGNPFITPSIGSSTTYYAEAVTDDGSCPSPTRTPIVAEIRPIPAMTSVNQAICSGSAPSITLSSVPAGATYTWTVTSSPLVTGYTNPGGGPTIQETLTNSSSVTPGAATYLVTPTLNQCPAPTPTPYVITVNPLPVPTITPQAIPVCVNAPITYSTETGMSGYTWQALPDGIISPPTATTSTISVTWPSPGANRKVTVSYTSGNGCLSSVPTEFTGITVNPLPNLVTTPASPLIICSGATALVQLQSTVPGTELNTTFNRTALAVNPPLIAPNPIPGGTGDISQVFNNSGSSAEDVIYTISPVSNGCQSNPVSYSFTVKVNPVADVAVAPASQEICSGDISVLVALSSAVAGATFTWSVSCEPGISSVCPPGSNGNIIPGATLTNSLLIPQHVTYTITPTANGCPGSDNTHSVTVKGRPTPTIMGPASVCLNTAGPQYFTEPLMLNYSWSAPGGNITPGPTPDIINVTWTVPGPHIMTVDYLLPGGCTALTPSTKTVNVNTLPVPALDGLSTICTGIQTTYTSDIGMQDYIWTYSAGATYVGGGGLNENFLTVIWNTPTPQTVSVNYTMGTLCTGATPTVKNITVNQSTPPVIQSLEGHAVCARSDATYSTQPVMTGYSWEISPGGHFTSAPGSNTITAHWDFSSPPQYVRVNFTNGFSCTPPTPTEYAVTVNPLPNPVIIPPSPPFCQDYPTLYTYSVAPDPTCSFTWDIQPPGSRVITPGPGPNEVQVQWTAPGPANITVTGTYIATGCTSTTAPFPVTIDPKPAVRFTPCFDQITSQSSRRFILKGGNPPYPLTGSPLQGVYLSTPATVALQPDPSGNYYFNPSLAAAGTYSISYRYTNQYGCPNTTVPVTLAVQGTTPPCGPDMTDPRDGKVYTTVFLAGRCWMGENLRYGNSIPQPQPQTDNCHAEKFCPPSDPTCTNGAFYQWDELVQYENTDLPYQGVCPPAWHIPTEAEWQAMINNLDPTFPPPSSDALLGAELKDPAKSFKARLEGISYLGSTWYFATASNSVTMFWTSTADGTGRAIARGLNSPYNPSISKYSSSRMNAFPVRCVKD